MIPTLIRTSALISTIICAFFACAGASVDKLTPESSIDTALKNNPMISIALENVKKADAVADESLVPGRPNVRIQSIYERLDKVPSLVLNDCNRVDVGTLYNRQADLILMQNLDLFGAVKAGRRAAMYSRAAAFHSYLQQVNDTIFDVMTAYYNVLRAQEYRRVEEETVVMLEAHREDAEKNFKAGTIPKFDVLRAETELANRKQGLIATQNGIELAKAAFNNILGRPLDTPVELAEPGKLQFVDFDLPACLKAATDARPELLRAKSFVDYSDETVKAIRLQNKPKFNLSYDYNRNLDVNIFNASTNSWKASVTSSLSLYDGGAARAAIRKAESDARNARSMQEQAVQGMKLDVQQSILSLQESRERINAAQKALDQATESRRLAELRFRGGVSTQVEVLDAQTALTLAKTNYVNAEYDYHLAQAKLEHAVGGKTALAKVAEHAGIISPP